MKIALDIMGGDRAPGEILKGALFASEHIEKIVLVGPKKFLNEELKGKFEVVDSSDFIPMDASPMDVLRRKDSSMHIGLRLLREGKVDAFVSAGATGPLFLGSTTIVGRVKNIERPSLAIPIPSLKGFTILIDGGANLRIRPKHYLEFAIMGIAYARILGKEDPKVGLLNVGEEETKGNEEIREAYKLLKEKLKDKFVGNVEGRDINAGTVDVVVTDGFSGNVALKTMEGMAKLISDIIKESIKRKGVFAHIGAIFLKGVFEDLKKLLDPRAYGGAFILGVNGVVVKAHGSSDALAIRNALKVARDGVEMKLVERIERGMENVWNSGNGG
ncbi:MAG: phosphate acyltransferase PlsX [Thermotogae bacterium]|nr:MAG: phosphate acyltransferase PlsX [Thermotogota bacterium]